MGSQVYQRDCNKGLVFGANRDVVCEDEVITSFVDSDFVGFLNIRKTLTGYVFTSFGTAISWKASLQKVVALSSTEVKYMALTEAIKEALWLLRLVRELKINKKTSDSVL